MRIDIVSDVTCPWCFIGKRRLERALALRPEVAAAVTWRPFQLNPDMPVSGMERQAYLSMKFGSAAQADRLYRNVAAAGATVDIPFDFARIRRTPNTRKAHALIRQALAEGVADATVERLFRAYFLEGRDIGDRATLLELAGEIGLGQSVSERALDDPASEERVIAEDRGARRLGINAVPCFIFDGQYAVSGAQEPEFFLPIFDLVRTGAEATA
ncbi:MAG TPA: DsbA family oxidoreductase [Stellaceae bacterium]|nr:DsbA family oxidoreductase [Stellaceae bacterium]